MHGARLRVKLFYDVSNQYNMMLTLMYVDYKTKKKKRKSNPYLHRKHMVNMRMHTRRFTDSDYMNVWLYALSLIYKSIIK